MIPIDRVIRIHELLISEFGGSLGVRDRNGLESALMRPFATFDIEELYSGAIEKAAAVAESILINHPFVDGNKRIGYVLMQLILLEGKVEIEASEDEKYEMVMAISTGQIDHEKICEWMREHRKKE
jgi:death-on-curing protein